MVKLKCVKCGISFKDRQDIQNTDLEAKCCNRCAFILSALRLTTLSLEVMNESRLNRKIEINFDQIKITKNKKND